MIAQGVMSEKYRIASRFTKAAEQYDRHARLQREVAKSLGAWAHLDVHIASRALDIGCGTGELYDMYQQSGAAWVNLDISTGMLKYAQARLSRNAYEQHTIDKFHSVDYICGDAEALPLVDQSVDFICSSMALQWCGNPAVVMAEIYRVLASKGRATLAVMVAPSFSSLHQAWQQIGQASRVNTFAAASHWLDAATALNWKVSSEQQVFYAHHSGILAALKSIKGVGANTKTQVRYRGALSKQELAQLQQCFSSKDSIELDYQVCFIDLQKS